MSFPTQGKTVHPLDTIQVETKPGTTVGQFGEFLLRMPAPTTNQVRCPDVEVQDHFVIVIALEDGEAAFEVFVPVEILGGGKPLLGELHALYETEHKALDRISLEIIPEGAPMVVTA